MENKDYQPENCYNVMCMVVAGCFTPAKKRSSREAKKARTTFANSKGLQMFCDCSDSFEAGKLRKQILEFLEKDFLKDKGKKSKHSKVISKTTKLKIKDLRKRGYTYEQIAFRTHCSAKTARAIVLDIK